MNIGVEKFVDSYPVESLLSIWKESTQKPDEYSRKRIDWAFFRNICGRARVWLLRDKNEGDYFGCSALLPRYFLVKGKKVPGALIADTAIKKEYRALGPALFLHEEILKSSGDLSFILAFPNRIAQAVIQRVGFKRAKNLVHYIKITKSKRAIEKKIKVPFLSTLFLFFAPIIDLGMRILDFRLPSRKKLICLQEDEFNEKFDYAWNEFRPKFDFLLERNSDYLKWRYRNNPDPSKAYKIFTVYKSAKNELAGYVVYFVKNGLAYVDDFIWIEEHLKLQRLLFLFVRAMRKKSVDAVQFSFMENRLIEKSFKRNLFFEIGKSSVLYYILDKSMAEFLPELINREKAFITSGDRDF